MKRPKTPKPPEAPVAAWPGDHETFDDVDDEEFIDDVPEKDLVTEPRQKRRSRKG